MWSPATDLKFCRASLNFAVVVVVVVVVVVATAAVVADVVGEDMCTCACVCSHELSKDHGCVQRHAHIIIKPQSGNRLFSLVSSNELACSLSLAHRMSKKIPQEAMQISKQG